MIKVATFTNNDEYCSEEMRALAYIVLPNGEYWGVRFNGATEEIARTKAISTWQHEQEKWKRLEPISNAPNTTINVNIVQTHHRAGKIWMRHKETRELVSIPLTEITMYEKQGFERGGPRSK